MSYRYVRSDANRNTSDSDVNEDDDDEEDEDDDDMNRGNVSFVVDDDDDDDDDDDGDMQRKYNRHPFTPECELKTIYVNYRRHGQSPLDVSFNKAIKLSICACRSISHVWGKFAFESKAAQKHNPDGSIVAIDTDLRSYRRIHSGDSVGTAFDPHRPLWVFVVDDRPSHRSRHRHRKRKRRRHSHRDKHPAHESFPPEPPLISCCNIM